MISLATILTINQDNAADILIKIKHENERMIKFGALRLTILQVLRQYDPNWHDVHDAILNPDIYFDVPAADWTEANQRTTPKCRKVNRTSDPQQKLIVTRSVAFLTGNGLKYDCNPLNPQETAIYQATQRVCDNNKMDYKNVQIATLMESETHCAELWYVVDNSTDQNNDDNNDFEGIAINTRGLSLRCKVLAYSLGDHLYPVWDYMGNMVAFLREYEQRGEENEILFISELYTDNATFIMQSNGAGQPVTSFVEKLNPSGKIQIIYYAQPGPEWIDVQHNIVRKEKLISNTGDINDKYASPTTVVNGEVEGFSNLGEKGTILEVGKDASVSLLESKNSIAGLEFELATLQGIIMEGTHTPDISFESMKSLGVFSGIALKMLFFDASLKVKSKLPTYGESVQRRLNFIKAALGKFDLSLKVASRMIIRPVIEAYLPQNIDEAITNLGLATAGQAIMSQETAIRQNPMVKNADAELLLVEADNKRITDAAKPAAPVIPIKAPLPNAA